VSARGPYVSESGRVKNVLAGDLLMDAGVRIALPPGYAGIVCPRSALALDGLLVGARLIDGDYRGTLKVNDCRERGARTQWGTPNFVGAFSERQ